MEGYWLQQNFALLFRGRENLSELLQGAESQACPTALPSSAGLGLRLGSWGFSPAVSFSVQEVRLKKRRGCVPGGGCEAERSAEAQAAAPRGSAFGMTDWPAHPAARGEAAPTEVCTDLQRPGGKYPLCPVCLDQPKTLLLPPAQKILVGQAKVTASF